MRNHDPIWKGKATDFSKSLTYNPSMVAVAAEHKRDLRSGIRDILGSVVTFLGNSHVFPVSLLNQQNY
jgi:hypothetical protein